MEKTTQREILLDQYSINLERLVKSKILLATLKEMDPDKKLKPHMADKLGMQDLRVTVKDRIKQVEDDKKIQETRVEKIEEMLENEQQQNK